MFDQGAGSSPRMIAIGKKQKKTGGKAPKVAEHEDGVADAHERGAHENEANHLTPDSRPSPRPNSMDPSDREAVKAQALDEEKVRYEDRTSQAHFQGARHAADIEIANWGAKNLKELEAQKKAVLETIQQALGVDNIMGRKKICESIKSEFARKVPKFFFLFIIVGCEIDLYGFLMSFGSYWTLNIVPLKMLLVTGPVGYCMAVAMFMYYTRNPEKDLMEKQPTEKPSRRPVPSTNPIKDQVLASVVPNSTSVEPTREHQELTIKVINDKEKVNLKYYHFVPIVRYYMVIKDQNPSDVEGLFRVNSLSSFTLGIAQMAGMLFTSAVGAPFDLFVKINVISQTLNWFITGLYFSTSISARMKASFKVDILMANSVTTLRNEYESYLHAVNAAQKGGGGEEHSKIMQAFHDALDYELREFVHNREVNLECLSMEEKYMIRLAIHRRMYSTYIKLN